MTLTLPTDRTAAAFRLMHQIERGELVEAPERDDWNLQTICMEQNDPPRRRLAVRVLAKTGKIAGLGCLYAAKGAWAVTRYVFRRMSSRRSVRITIIEW